MFVAQDVQSLAVVPLQVAQLALQASHVFVPEIYGVAPLGSHVTQLLFAVPLQVKQVA